MSNTSKSTKSGKTANKPVPLPARLYHPKTKQTTTARTAGRLRLLQERGWEPAQPDKE